MEGNLTVLAVAEGPPFYAQAEGRHVLLQREGEVLKAKGGNDSLAGRSPATCISSSSRCLGDAAPMSSISMRAG